MKTTSKMILAGAILSGSQCFAQANKAPESCNTVAKLGVQVSGLRLEEGSLEPINLTLTSEDAKNYVVTESIYLGNCDDESVKLKPTWCQVAGGSPDIYQLEVAKIENTTNYPRATVIVTYNRGGCRLNDIIKK